MLCVMPLPGSGRHLDRFLQELHRLYNLSSAASFLSQRTSIALNLLSYGRIICTAANSGHSRF